MLNRVVAKKMRSLGSPVNSITESHFSYASLWFWKMCVHILLLLTSRQYHYSKGILFICFCLGIVMAVTNLFTVLWQEMSNAFEALFEEAFKLGQPSSQSGFPYTFFKNYYKYLLLLVIVNHFWCVVANKQIHNWLTSASS